MARAPQRRGGAPPVSKKTLEDRLAFLNLGEADLRLLGELRPLLERHADRLVAGFYRHLLSFEETRELLRNERVKERLLREQRRYLLSLAGPRLDEEYVAERRRIGDAHERAGLEPSYYLGAYSLYFSLLSALVCEAQRAEPERAERTLVALVRLLTLDAQIGVDAYIESRERQLEYLTRELSDMGRDLAQQVEHHGAELRETTRRVRAAEELASIGALVAGLAHEIGTPMGVIQGHAEALESTATDERVRWRARTIGEQIERISTIIRALLNMARPHEADEQAPRARITLESLVGETLSFLVQKMRNHAIALEQSLNPAPEIVGEPERLQQVFLNLFLNAIDAMPQGGTLRVDLAPVDGRRRVEVRVSDTGVGIPAASLPRIFDPFYTTKASGRGSGLGLVVANGIVIDHGGEIEVHSESGQGTEFVVRLPAA